MVPKTKIMKFKKFGIVKKKIENFLNKFKLIILNLDHWYDVHMSDIEITIEQRYLELSF